jgi:hypothetical protein
VVVGSVFVRTWFAAASQHFEGLLCSAGVWADARSAPMSTATDVRKTAIFICASSLLKLLLGCRIRFRPVATSLANDPLRVVVR